MRDPDQVTQKRLNEITQQIKAASFADACEMVYRFGAIMFQEGLRCRVKTNSSE